MGSHRVKLWMIVAGAAAALTVALPLAPHSWGESDLASVIAAPLSFGLILASLPFGGLHSGPPVVPVLALASILNAAIWGAAFWVQAHGWRRRAS
jgi:hypothetical protein